jgi:hypothetical protein
VEQITAKERKSLNDDILYQLESNHFIIIIIIIILATNHPIAVDSIKLGF